MLGRTKISRFLSSITPPGANIDISRDCWEWGLEHRTEFYLRAHRYFHTALPRSLVEHRLYYRQDQRSFGEDAFHSLWYQLYINFQPRRVLEIGLYRGQTISLWTLLARHFHRNCSVHGISPLTPAGDSDTAYLKTVDYEQDIKSHFEHFQLPLPNLCRAYSTDPAAHALIASGDWDWIYIDGNHDYDIAKQDWTHCRMAVKPGGLIIFDDAALETGYKNPSFAFPGHPGPSRLIREIDPAQFREIVAVGHNRVFQKI